ncbi:hypothetical protein PHYBOEH_002827 [Phytophthora boehmeriae]|uniref:Uncharacterized protein n=1 Tax=Phytophthora boehmeriae TaxID=109152 RepID=A0A8T1WSA3_9STRA|nr:hypothetical protein PHYBOEH_002827 [Phytophthora boehmeriae]
MLSCKTFLKLFAVAVALSDFASTAHARATDCEMVYDPVMPAPTVSITPCPKGATTVNRVQASKTPNGNPTDVEGQSDTRQDPTQTGGAYTPSTATTPVSDVNLPGPITTVPSAQTQSTSPPILTNNNGNTPCPNTSKSTPAPTTEGNTDVTPAPEATTPTQDAYTPAPEDQSTPAPTTEGNTDVTPAPEATTPTQDAYTPAPEDQSTPTQDAYTPEPELSVSVGDDYSSDDEQSMPSPISEGETDVTQETTETGNAYSDDTTPVNNYDDSDDSIDVGVGGGAYISAGGKISGDAGVNAHGHGGLDVNVGLGGQHGLSVGVGLGGGIHGNVNGDLGASAGLGLNVGIGGLNAGVGVHANGGVGAGLDVDASVDAGAELTGNNGDYSDANQYSSRRLRGNQ